jgi:hypothetical protein
MAIVEPRQGERVERDFLMLDAGDTSAALAHAGLAEGRHTGVAGEGGAA